MGAQLREYWDCESPSVFRLMLGAGVWLTKIVSSWNRKPGHGLFSVRGYLWLADILENVQALLASKAARPSGVVMAGSSPSISHWFPGDVVARRRLEGLEDRQVIRVAEGELDERQLINVAMVRSGAVEVKELRAQSQSWSTKTNGSLLFASTHLKKFLNFQRLAKSDDGREARRRGTSAWPALATSRQTWRKYRRWALTIDGQVVGSDPALTVWSDLGIANERALSRTRP
jgi:hypothetical protein